MYLESGGLFAHFSFFSTLVYALQPKPSSHNLFTVWILEWYGWFDMDIASSETIDDNFFKRKFSLIYNCLNRVFFLETQRWKKYQAGQS